MGTGKSTTTTEVIDIAKNGDFFDLLDAARRHSLINKAQYVLSEELGMSRMSIANASKNKNYSAFSHKQVMRLISLLAQTDNSELNTAIGELEPKHLKPLYHSTDRPTLAKNLLSSAGLRQAQIYSKLGYKTQSALSAAIRNCAVFQPPLLDKFKNLFTRLPVLETFLPTLASEEAFEAFKDRNSNKTKQSPSSEHLTYSIHEYLGIIIKREGLDSRKHSSFALRESQQSFKPLSPESLEIIMGLLNMSTDEMITARGLNETCRLVRNRILNNDIEYSPELAAKMGKSSTSASISLH